MRLGRDSKQGLCVSWEGADDEGERLLGALTVPSQPGRHALAPRPVEQDYRGVAQQRHDRRPLPGMD